MVIFARFFATASVRSRSLDQPLVPGVFVVFITQIKLHTENELVEKFVGVLTSMEEIGEGKYGTNKLKCERLHKWRMQGNESIYLSSKV